MRVYLDTNSFYFLFFDDEVYSRGIRKIFERMHKGELEGITSALTFDELAYTILLRLIEKKYKNHPSIVLRDSKRVVLEFVDEIQEIFDTVFSFDNLEVVSAGKGFIKSIPFIMERHLLLPRDCIHLRTMFANGCKRILSTDSDFDGVEGIERIKPEKV